MSICRARLRNTSNALMLRMSGEQTRLQVPPKFLESTAGSRKWSSSEFQTVGPATDNARVPKVLRRTRGTDKQTNKQTNENKPCEAVVGLFCSWPVRTHSAPAAAICKQSLSPGVLVLADAANFSNATISVTTFYLTSPTLSGLSHASCNGADFSSKCYNTRRQDSKSKRIASGVISFRGLYRKRQALASCFLPIHVWAERFSSFKGQLQRKFFISINELLLSLIHISEPTRPY